MQTQPFVLCGNLEPPFHIMNEILTILITVLSATSVTDGTTTKNFLPFDGEAKSEYFQGKVIPGGVDTQTYSAKGGDLSARYILEGVDCSGKPCKIFIENNGKFGEEFTHPRIVTDSDTLKFLNNNPDIKGKLDMSDGKLTIRIYADKNKKATSAASSSAPVSVALATEYHLDLTKPVPTYTDETGCGLDDVPSRLSGKPVNQTLSKYYSFRVPDGNYRVKMVIGAKKKASVTTVRAENRRLLVHDLATKKGQYETVEFVVNKRTPEIAGSKNRVAVKDREKLYLTWDDRLTLEVTGDAPAVQSISVERDDKVPTVYLCGNSTVVDQSYEPWASWGQMITKWFGPEVAVSNHAESGLATFSFISGRRFEKILSEMKAGDYVIVEFGHNDEKDKRPGRGAWYNFSYELKVFIDEVRAKGGNIILCTPTQRRSWENGNKVIANTHGDFPAAIRAVAERENVPLIDLADMTKTFFETLGYEDSKRALVHYPMGTFEGQQKAFADNTHFNPFGAYEVSKMVVMGLKKLNSPLVNYLRPLWQDFNPSQPDDWNTFHWSPSPMTELIKPDGN